MRDVFVTLMYGLLAAVVGFVLFALGIAPRSIAILIGAVAFLTLSQFQSALAHRKDRRHARSEIARLKQKAREMAAELNDTNARIDEAKAVAEAQSNAQGKKIVSELKMLEGLMREFAQRISEKAQRPATAAAQIAAPAVRQTGARSYVDALGEPQLLETIRASLEENRVDLYLQPIVSLPQRKLRYYEALSRLRSQDGAVIMPAQYMRVAAPAGLMSVVDNLLLFRCVQIVRRLVAKHREVGVFCNISGATLTDTEFFPQFLEYMHQNRDLAPHIVFEFAQDEVADAGKQGEENLAYLASLGFSLSLDHVKSLSIDFGKLKRLGFRHIKVRAGTLITGMSDANALVAAEDLKQLLQRHGLNLIAEHVEDEKTVVQLLDFAVDFAQGYLFGEPRAVRDEAIKMPEPSEQAAIIPFKRMA